ncbi:MULTISPECIES: HAD family phosphatase [Chryseobacterium]|uniref:HAD superfamily hydrolase (TIGR01509 family) n=1 Tax=Chryseobacterium geocarposphaerae TaxID=1416776 RepID=A0ABU1LIP2_9FLAO|nr:MULTISPECIES: HAD family phosphatase [Chryseobacterium]ALR31564.1 HAD family hydrolase [Chryseobacterium sp. IHB B 17019]MDR6406425.1 HAD superfamily hydrolase (TIGR01509 family) [Chryseobacterium geocarposphaerae]MDR6699861.1 HAD superfamily hydrolase (TIGR01509 family) [Chryseobacterium ginsenosidimutans]
MRFNEKAIIFDMDGTLVDNIRYHEESWLIFLKEHGIDMEPDNFAAQNHGTMDEMIIRFFGEGLSGGRVQELGLKKEETYQNLYQKHIREVNGLTPFLQKLAQKNIKTGLATMGIPSSIDFILNSLNIRNYFHEITGGIEVTKGKPHPEIFLKTLEKLNVDGKEAVAVEDSVGGIKAAKNAGLKVVGIATTHSKEEMMDNGCFHVINDYSEIEIA